MNAAPGRAPAVAQAVFVAAAAALATATVLRLPAAWATGNALNHVSGAWLTHAEDLASGAFYRPLTGPEPGTGGTRFFPLLFAAHAGLRAAGADLLASAYLLSLLAGLAVLLGVYGLARAAGRAPLPSAAFAALAFGALASQQALTAARGDLLPVGLSALGLAALARRAHLPARAWLPLAVLAFALAFAAKPTALTAPAAGALWLWLGGDRRAALALAGAAGLATGGVVLATDALSGGRFLALLAACASGGATPLDVLRGPVRLAAEVWNEDPAAMLLVGGAALSVLAALPGHLRGARAAPLGAAALPALWLLAALAGAAVVFGSPGTGANHLVEVEAAAAAALAGAWDAAGRARRLARVAAPVAALGGFAVALQLGAGDHRTSRRAELRAVIALLPEGPVLSEDPLVPLTRGERPFLLDPWMLRLAAARAPAVAAPLEERVRRHMFGAVVLYGDLDDPALAGWYGREHLGPHVADAIRAAYRPALRHGRYLVYLPAAPGPPPAPGRRPVLATDRR